jgi:hypothetical protein
MKTDSPDVLPPGVAIFVGIVLFSPSSIVPEIGRLQIFYDVKRAFRISAAPPSRLRNSFVTKEEKSRLDADRAACAHLTAKIA